jgi:NAD+ synthase (glutamine-hydrolysing)
LRVAAVSPDFLLGDPQSAAQSIIKLARQYWQKGAKLIVFPELSLTGYTIADMFDQELIQEASLAALQMVCEETKDIDAILVVGMPLLVDTALFNVAAVIDQGRIAGIVPKTYIPTSNEFYEGRWFVGADSLLHDEVIVLGQNVPIGTDILFRSKQNPTAVIGIEICEDLWVPVPPSSFAALAGATVIVNLSASNELVNKAEYRIELVKNQSGRCISAYVYASAGACESTTDVVFGGHCLAAENGRLIAQNERFAQKSTGIIVDLDTEELVQERIRTTSFAQSARKFNNKYRAIEINLATDLPKELLRPNPASPFVSDEPVERAKACAEVFNIQVAGLAKRLRSMEDRMRARRIKGVPHVIIGLSGGLDSTLAYLVAVKAFEVLDYDLANIHIYSMPYGGCTSRATRSNANKLAKALGIKLSKIPIDRLTAEILRASGHDAKTQDVTFENAQARARTLILMQKSNMHLPAIVIGTGDLSELALGWCTFNGDHMSHYNVNCGVPKTLVSKVVDWVADTTDNKKLARTLKTILATPISPELTEVKSGKIAQITEEIIGPYALHDFFLYRMVRRGCRPGKIVYLAELAFAGIYSRPEIVKWLKVFVHRFFDAQFKRSSMPDGPRVGLVDLSQRGSLRMPSDMLPQAWVREMKDL